MLSSLSGEGERKMMISIVDGNPATGEIPFGLPLNFRTDGDSNAVERKAVQRFEYNEG